MPEVEPKAGATDPESMTLYLRGVPAKLVREAKALAARRGVTLRTLVAEALETMLAQKMPPHPVLQPEETETGSAEVRADMEWYETHKAELLPDYEGLYVAIVQQAIVDHDREFGAVARRVFERFKDRPVFVTKVVRGEREARIASPRVSGT